MDIFQVKVQQRTQPNKLMNPIETSKLPFRLGCPVWNCVHWAGTVYPSGAAKTKWLHWYSRMFNTVEGNSTFYGLPSLDIAKRWADETVDGFQFALKVPRSISHECRLIDCQRERDAFIEFASVLQAAGRLGPSFLQLPPTFGVDGFETLKAFLCELPSEIPWAVELRHHDWFDQSTHEQRSNQLLSELSMDKVLFDSRPLYQAAPDDAIEATSQTRKPKTPVRQTVTGQRPMLRLVGRNRIELTERFIQQWIPIVGRWIDQGLEPYIFTHAPDDQFAPAFAELFWARYCDYRNQNAAVHESSAGYDLDSLQRPPRPPEQLEFF